MTVTKNHKYIFVIGGVMSGVGKGVATASIGKILGARGFAVNLMKIDPYLNVDAGNMNPTEHGEVFVLPSGLETDQDMGNYERFLGRDLDSEDYMTSGMVYQAVIARERSLGYGGKCVEAIPHVREEIIERIEKSAKASKSDITVIEIGGTVGDFQNAMVMEAARVMHFRHPGHVLFAMVSYLPVPGTLGEMKTKPTQNAIRQLNGYGIQPDLIIARAPVALDDRRKEKIATQCNVHTDHVISAPDVKSIYDVPLNFERDNLSTIILKSLNLSTAKRGEGLAGWEKMAAKAHNGSRAVKIGIVGKYFDTGDFVLSDAYLSVIEAIKFSAYEQGVRPEISWISAKDFQEGKGMGVLKKYDGLIVPGGFGETGIEGKINAIKFARENKIPYFGLCYGMQLMVIEFARHVAKIKGAHTVEIDPKTPAPIIDIMPDQKEKMKNKNYGGTMRLGAYPAVLTKGTSAFDAYKKAGWGTVSKDGETLGISERHRHRYEVNPEYIEQLKKAGLVFSGVSPDGTLMEIAELSSKDHPFMLGTQFHPEFTARPLTPQPLFTAFIKAALAQKK